MRSLLQDIRFGARMLAKNPAFTAVAVLTLALGIGANTTIFSVVNCVLLEPLPYPNSGRLVWLSERTPDFPSVSLSYPNFVDWHAQQTAFEHLGVYNQTGNFILTREGEPQRLNGVFMSSRVFAALRVPPVLGRVFTADDDRPGAPSVVILTHHLWQSRFGGQSNIVDRLITLNGRVHAVVGVMPAHFKVPDSVDFWVSIASLAGNPGYQDRGWNSGFFGIARLKPDVTLEQAITSMDAIAVRLERQYPDKNRNKRAHVEPLLAHYVNDVRRSLWTLLGAVGLVLFIACVNVANLLLARTSARMKEISLRAALGAGRTRIVRQLLTESLLLAAGGAASGWWLARAALPIILAISDKHLPRTAEIGLDLRVLAFTAAASVFAGLLFGLVPALQATRPNLHDVLKGRGATSGAGDGSRLRRGLVVAEVALTMLLLVSATLLIRSFYLLQQVNAGFAHERVLSFRFDLLGQRYPSEELYGLFCRNLINSLRSLPGVQAASVTSRIPLDPTEASQTFFLIEGRAALPPGERPFTELSYIGPEYFRALGIPVLRGRAFADIDDRSHLLTKQLGNLSPGERWMAGLSKVIIDEDFARRYWPNEDPIGRRIRLPWSPNGPLLEVIGVVGRVRLDRLSERGQFVQAYLSFFEAPQRGMAVVLKTTLAPEALITAVRQQVRRLDPELALYDIRTLAEVRDSSIAPQRLNLTLLAAFAAVALALAIVGLYGVLTYGVTRRRREIGIRMAVGAQRADILSLVIGEGMRLTLLGVGIGIVASLALTRVMRTLLYEISPTDPLTLIVIPILLGVVALFACYLPARRAAKIDPIVALRYE